MTYFVKKGTCGGNDYHFDEDGYIGYFPMGGSGFTIEPVKAGSIWKEGVGEEFFTAADTKEDVLQIFNEVYGHDEKL